MRQRERGRRSRSNSRQGCAPLVPVRMVNEWVYCPRLAFLEWVDGEWAEVVTRARDRPAQAGRAALRFLGDVANPILRITDRATMELGRLRLVGATEEIDFPGSRHVEPRANETWAPGRGLNAYRKHADKPRPPPRLPLDRLNGIGDGGQVAAPAGRAVDLVRASQWIKRRNAPTLHYMISRVWIEDGPQSYFFIDSPRDGWIADIQLEELRGLGDRTRSPRARSLGVCIT